jgi:outer membrane protein W
MFKGQSIRILAACVVASALVGSAIADMVYDDENTMSAAPTKVEIKTIVNSPSSPAPIAAPIATEVVSTQPVVVETQKIQKESEKSKEKRGFRENVNNELVIQKLEDKRLKQEEKLTAEINKKFTLEDDATPAGTAAPVMHEQSVVKPITDTPGAENSAQMTAAPKAETIAAKPIAQDQIAIYQSSTSMSAAPAATAKSETSVTVKTEGEKASKTGISVTPIVGLSTISNQYYDFKNNYTAGVGLGFDVSDNVQVSLSYAYADYQVGLAGQSQVYGYANNPLTFKNNTFDLAVKLYLTGQESKIRPFVGAGLGYSLGYVNYNQNTLGNYGYQWQSNDYSLNQVLGGLQTGIDLKISSNVSIGFTYKYFKPISTTESDQGLYNGGFYSPSAYGYGYSSAAYLDPNKEQVRGTLRDSSSSMFLVNATVLF